MSTNPPETVIEVASHDLFDFCGLCESEDCPCKNDADNHCPTCKHLVGSDGYCTHCVALGDGNPYQSNN